MKDTYFENEIKMLERLVTQLEWNNPGMSGTKTVYYVKRRNKTEYYLVENGVRTYVQKERYGEIKPVIQAEYDRKLLDCAKKRLQVLEWARRQLEKCNLEDVYSSMKESRKAFVAKRNAVDDAYVKRWLKASPLCVNDPKGRIFPTDRGEKVRSKSEALIANRLYREGIPYRYEFAVEMRKGRIRFPDFMVLNVRTGEEFYLEHLGRTGDPKYMAVNLEKLEEYADAGIVLGKNLLLTFECEDWPYTGRLLEDYVRLHFK